MPGNTRAQLQVRPCSQPVCLHIDGHWADSHTNNQVDRDARVIQIRAGTACMQLTHFGISLAVCLAHLLILTFNNVLVATPEPGSQDSYFIRLFHLLS